MSESQVSKNAVYNIIKSISSIIFPLITFPYISRVLLTENVGKINFGQSVLSYISLIASLGISTYAIRECAKVKNDKRKLSEISGQLLSLNLCTTALAYLVLALLLVFARPLAGYRLLIAIQSINILFATLGADWLNTAMEDLRYVTIRTVAFQIFSLLLMFLFVHEPDDYLLYAVISVISSSGANVANMFYRRRYCRVRLTFKIDWKKHLPPVLLMFSLILSQTIYCNSDVTMLGLMKGDHEVGLYSVSVKIYTIVNTLVASIAYVVMPKMSYWFTLKNYEEINRLLKYALNFIIVLGMPCITGITAIAPELIDLISGEAYLEAATSLLILMIALAASFAGGFIGNIIFLPSGREHICLKSGIVSALVNVIANFILIPQFGLNAAAATTAFSEIVSLLIGIRYVEKEVRIEGIKKMVLSPAVGCVSILAVVFLLRLTGLEGKLWTIAAIVCSAAVYGGVLLLMKNEFVIGFGKSILDRQSKR